MTWSEIQNSQKQSLNTGNERGFHEVRSAFLSRRFFGLSRKDLFHEQDEQA